MTAATDIAEARALLEQAERESDPEQECERIEEALILLETAEDRRPQQAELIANLRMSLRAPLPQPRLAAEEVHVRDLELLPLDPREPGAGDRGARRRGPAARGLPARVHRDVGTGSAGGAGAGRSERARRELQLRQLTATVRGDPVRVSVCHCLACQKRTAASFRRAGALSRAMAVGHHRPLDGVRARGRFRRALPFPTSAPRAVPIVH
jgi:hypothetical protein